MSARSLINIVVFPFSAYVQLLYEWLNGGLVRFCPWAVPLEKKTCFSSVFSRSKCLTPSKGFNCFQSSERESKSKLPSGFFVQVVFRVALRSISSSCFNICCFIFIVFSSRHIDDTTFNLSVWSQNESKGDPGSHQWHDVNQTMHCLVSKWIERRPRISRATDQIGSDGRSSFSEKIDRRWSVE